MTKRSEARIVVDVRYEDGQWVVRLGSGPITIAATWELKVNAVDRAARMARELTLFGAKSQVRVWTREGRISREMTYGEDPTRRKG